MKRASEITYKQGNDYLRVPSDKTINYNQMNKHCYLLLISMVFLIFYATELIAQGSSQTPSGFPLGVFSHIENEGQTSIDLMVDAGINYIVDDKKDVINNTAFNIMGNKKSEDLDYIFYYSKGYYTS